jgi:sortase A
MKTRVLSSPAVARRRVGRLPLRRLVRDISSVLMISGLLLVLDAGATLVWQEPVTAVIALVKRSEIDKQYLSFQTAPLTPVERHVLVKLPNYSQRIAYLARREQHQVGTGDAVGHISIPKIGAGYDVVQGTDEASLEKGPGHYPDTSATGPRTWRRSATSTRSNPATGSC